MDVESLVSVSIMTLVFTILVMGLTKLVVHRFSLTAVLAIPGAWVVLVLVSIFNEELPRVVHRLAAMTGHRSQEFYAILESLKPYGVNFAKGLNPNTVLLTAILLLLGVGISAIVGELEKLNAQFKPKTD